MTATDGTHTMDSRGLQDQAFPKHVRHAVIDRIAAHSMLAQRGLSRSQDTADLILADLDRAGYGELLRFALPVIRALQRLASTEWIITPTGDNARDQMAETRARAELAKVTLSGMGISWRRRV